MRVGFKAIGLYFEADVNFDPGDDEDPLDGDDVEFVSLTCDELDASFLSESSVFWMIESAAIMAVRQEVCREMQQVIADLAAESAMDGDWT